MGAIADFLSGMMCDEGDTVCEEKMKTYEKYGIISVVAIVAIVILMVVIKKKGGPTLSF
jgi:hypothetical protein